MDFLIDLWMPIVVSAVVVFFVSYLVWMVLPHHKADVKTLPNQAGFDGMLTEMNLAPGTYMWPCTDDPKDMKTDAFKDRFNKGPWGSMIVLGKKPNFGANLASVFIFYIVVGIFVGYLAYTALPYGSEFMRVFRFTGVAAVMAYCLGAIPGAVFFGKPVRFMATEFLDGVVYGLLTGVVFGLLWPSVDVVLENAAKAIPSLPGT